MLPSEISLPLASGPLPSSGLGATSTTTSTTLLITTTKAFDPIAALEVESGSGCWKDQWGCVMSDQWQPDAGLKYPENSGCTINVVPSGGTKLEVEDFNTEGCCDRLTVNGRDYSGWASDLSGVVATGTMSWTSDYSLSEHGWKICPTAPPAKGQLGSKTAKGCRCQDDWTFSGEHYRGCANPDSDPGGIWCWVQTDDIDGC